MERRERGRKVGNMQNVDKKVYVEMCGNISEVRVMPTS